MGYEIPNLWEYRRFIFFSIEPLRNETRRFFVEPHKLWGFVPHNLWGTHKKAARNFQNSSFPLSLQNIGYETP